MTWKIASCESDSFGHHGVRKKTLIPLWAEKQKQGETGSQLSIVIGFLQLGLSPGCRKFIAHLPRHCFYSHNLYVVPLWWEATRAMMARLISLNGIKNKNIKNNSLMEDNWSFFVKLFFF